MTRHTSLAVREAIDAIAGLGVDEIILVPATAEMAEIERAAEVIT